MSKFALDIARYRAKGTSSRDIWTNPAVWAIAAYRLGNWLNTDPPAAPLRLPLKLASFILNKLCEVVMEMCLDPAASIGEGLYIGHIGGVHINPGAIVGKNCDIAHRVTIGTSAMGRKGAPTIGDEVYIGTGASIIGKIRIGSGAKIASNTLVINNVPEGCTVMGVPGRVIMRPAPPAAAPAAPATETEHVN